LQFQDAGFVLGLFVTSRVVAAVFFQVALAAGRVNLLGDFRANRARAFVELRL